MKYLKKRTILIICVMFILNISHNDAISQILPTFKGTRTNNESYFKAIELFDLRYSNGQYKINDLLSSNTAKYLSQNICQILEKKKDSLSKSDMYYFTAVLSIDKETPMIVVDSILNEIMALSNIRIFYKTDFSNTSGFYITEFPPNELKVKTFMKNNFYFPDLLNIENCIWGIEKIYFTNKSMDSDLLFWGGPAPYPPIFRYVYPGEIIINNALDSIIDGYRYYQISKSNKSYFINSSKYSIKNIGQAIEQCIVKNNSVFIIDFDKSDCYNDYLELYEVVCQSVYNVRDNYVKTQIQNKVTSKENYDSLIIVNESRELYPLSIHNYSISDKLFNDLLKK